MKRIVLSLTILTFTLGAFAQQGGLEIPGEEFEAKASKVKFVKNEKLNEDNDWYNFYQEMSQLSGSWVSFLDYLFPDSTVMWVGTGAGNYVWKCAQGQVLDPTSGLFVFDSKPINKAANYNLDSIAIPYAYRRIQNGPPDTLLIQVIKQDQMSVVPLPNWTTPLSYARPAYNQAERKGENAVKEFKIPLTEADTAVNFSRTLAQEIDVAIAPDEVVAVTVHYIPGNPYNTDDTLSRTENGPGIINNFAIYNGRDEGKTENNDYYNHNLMITKEIAYGVNSNNWNDKYIPGVAWNSGIYHTNIYFNITFDDYSGLNDNDRVKRFDVYPNPANDIVNVEYEISGGQRISVEFTDILGHKVYEEVLSNSVDNRTRIDVSNWNKGLYFYSVIIDGQVARTSRIVVAD